MTFTLGYKPEKFKLDLSPGSDFFAGLERDDDTDWPDGSEVTLEVVGGESFPADLAGPVASWEIDEVQVDEIIDLKPKKIKLWYVEGTTRLLWGIGTLVVTK